LLTGRQAVMISDVTQLKRKAGDYLVIRRSRGVYDPIADYDQISPYSEEFSHVAEELPIIFENAGFIIFQLKRPTEAD
jgi:hypothetical protein